MSGQDIKLTLLPGQTLNQAIPGDYIYCKFADRPVTVIIGGSKVAMEGGDKYRPKPFANFEVRNDDKTRPIVVILTVGQGDYNRQIIQGEITVAPGIRRADGSMGEDTRYEIQAMINAKYNQSAQTRVMGDVLAAVPNSNTFLQNGWIESGEVRYLEYPEGTNGPARILRFDFDMNLVGEFHFPTNTGATRAIQAAPRVDGSGYVWLKGRTQAGNETGVWRWNTDTNSDEQIFDTSFRPTAIAAAPGGYILTRSDGSSNCFIHYVSADGEPLKTVNLTANFDYSNNSSVTLWLAYDAFNDRISISRSPSTTRDDEILVLNGDASDIVRKTGDFQVSVTGLGTNSGARFFVVGDTAFGHDRLNDRLVKAQFNEVTVTLEAVATRADCGNALLRADREGRETSADVEVSHNNGQSLVSGQLIKATLELFFGGRVDSDYMDHVYTITIYNTGTNAVLESKGGRGSTLAALSIEDKFTAVFPGRIDLTVDSGLNISPAI